MTLLEKCRLVAYYGDISEEARRRWDREHGRKTIAEILSAKASDQVEENVGNQKDGAG